MLDSNSQVHGDRGRPHSPFETEHRDNLTALSSGVYCCRLRKTLAGDSRKLAALTAQDHALGYADQFWRVDWLDKVLVDARLKTEGIVLGGVAYREHDYGKIRPRIVLANLTDQLESVNTG